MKYGFIPMVVESFTSIWEEQQPFIGLGVHTFKNFVEGFTVGNLIAKEVAIPSGTHNLRCSLEEWTQKLKVFGMESVIEGQLPKIFISPYSVVYTDRIERVLEGQTDLSDCVRAVREAFLWSIQPLQGELGKGSKLIVFQQSPVSLVRELCP